MWFWDTMTWIFTSVTKKYLFKRVSLPFNQFSFQYNKVIKKNFIPITKINPVKKGYHLKKMVVSFKKFILLDTYVWMTIRAPFYKIFFSVHFLYFVAVWPTKVYSRKSWHYADFLFSANRPLAMIRKKVLFKWTFNSITDFYDEDVVNILPLFVYG